MNPILKKMKRKKIILPLIAAAALLPAIAVGMSHGSHSRQAAAPAAQALTAALPAAQALPQAAEQPAPAEKEYPKKVLIIGDSMTGWLADRLGAYGAANGFDTAAVIWDGSTIGKWADSASRIKEIIAKEKPDAIIISLGLNELLERNPKRYDQDVEKIVSAFGQTPFLWIGPPSWPGRPGGEALNAYLDEKLGDGHYFNSSKLKLPRQSSTNPHPTQAGCSAWMDDVIEWLPTSRSAFLIPAADRPAAGKTVRPASFLYRKMKDAL